MESSLSSIRTGSMRVLTLNTSPARSAHCSQGSVMTPRASFQFIVHSEADAWCTLDGRKLDGKPTQKGVYVNNGKKIVIK